MNKKKFVLIALTILLAAALTACSDTTLEDYLELESAFFAVRAERESTLTVETRIEFTTVRNVVLYITTTQIKADGLDESIERHLILDRRGDEIAEMEAILIDDSGYVNINSIMSFTLYGIFSSEGGSEMLEFLGLSLDDISYDDILGGSYTHMQFTDEMLQELLEDAQDRLDSWTGLYRAFDEEVLEDYLSLDGDVFRIAILGEAVYTYIVAALEETNLDDPGFLFAFFTMVADFDAELIAELEDDFAGWVRSADLEDARLIVKRTQINENTYHQNIELYVPERISIEMDATLVVGESTPISAPSIYLTGGELESRLEAWLIGLINAANPSTGQDTSLVGTGSAPSPWSAPPIDGGDEIPQELLGTWICQGGGDRYIHMWVCRLTFNSDGTFMDRDGGRGRFAVRGNYLTLAHDTLGTLPLVFCINGNQLTTRVETGTYYKTYVREMF